MNLFEFKGRYAVSLNTTIAYTEPSLPEDGRISTNFTSSDLGKPPVQDLTVGIHNFSLLSPETL